ncbi:hypothetical protein B0T26DRAFT_308563 [Lasiosphaeria miniovina]|uniref:Transmembrane protein n=1 Tax=Lasiosphaeria miniovina TaxID=1954250 RepID=A0AA40ALB0_9PEZI|nr:uncharacterized protein B0T26DRAFT_308563 [Lasiosphaeria miniovina]KAK0717914.1 hypothetical protein B0T26DRAFT_308563 [Lasiosphaeria miniovina]
MRKMKDACRVSAEERKEGREEKTMMISPRPIHVGLWRKGVMDHRNLLLFRQSTITSIFLSSFLFSFSFHIRMYLPHYLFFNIPVIFCHFSSYSYFI